MLATLSVTVTVSWGLLYYAFPVLAPQIVSDTGWSAQFVTLAFSGSLVVSALLGVPVGKLIDRHGPRWVMALGSLLSAAALALVAASDNSIVFAAAWILAGFGMSGVLYQPAFAAITSWYGARSLGPLTTLTLVAGLSATVFAPLVAHVGAAVGWRGTYLWSAVALALVTAPAHWILLRHSRPQQHADHTARSLDERGYVSGALRRGQFWLLTAGLTIASAAIHTVLIAMMALMLERGLTTSEAAWVLGLGGIGQVAGRVFYTAFARRASLTMRTGAAFAIVAVSAAAFAILSGPFAVLVGISMAAGVGRGIGTLLQATAVTDRWGPRAYGQLSGIVGTPTMLVTAMAPWIGVVLAGAFGSYAAAFGALAVIAGIATLLLIASARVETRSPLAHVR